jgi:hypothetical protein
MPPSKLVRGGALGAVVAGVAWAASDIFILLLTGEGYGRLVEWMHAIAEAGMLAALVGFHVLQARSLGRLGVVGFAIAFVGVALVLVATLLVVIFPELPEQAQHALGLLFGLGLLGGLVGFVLFGITTLRARVLPRWCGLLLVGYPLLLLVAYLLLVLVGLPLAGPGVLVGLLWLALGYVLWTWSDIPAEPSSRVS